MERVNKISMIANKLILVGLLLFAVSCKDEKEELMLGRGYYEPLKLVEEMIPYPYTVIDDCYYFIELPSEETNITLYSEDQVLLKLVLLMAVYYVDKQEGYSLNEYYEELPPPEYVDIEYNASHVITSLKSEHMDILVGEDGLLQFRIPALSSDYPHDNKVNALIFVSPSYRAVAIRFIQRK